MKRHAIFPMVLFITLSLLLAGCPHEKYTLEMSVRKGVLHRKLTVEHMNGEGSGPVSAEELNIVAKAYNHKPYTKDMADQTFTGEFTGKTPDDIGGDGSVLYYESALGSVIAYIETFRGNDDVYAQLDIRMKAIEKTAQLLRGWLKHEFGAMKDFDKLDSFVVTQLEPDSKSLAIYVWMMVNAKKELSPRLPESLQTATTQPATTKPIPPQPSSDSPEKPPCCEEDQPKNVFVVRMLHYLLKRNYLTEDNLPHLLSEDMWNGDEPDARAQREKLFRRILVEKAGLKDRTPLLDAVVKLVCDFEALRKSVEDFIKTTPEYKKFLKEAQARAATQPATKPATEAGEPPKKPNPESEAMNAYADSLGLYTLAPTLVAGIVGPTDDELVVKLALPSGVEPLETNGKPDPKTGQIQWYGNIPGLNPGRGEPYPGYLPVLCYALWAEPNETLQKKQFGKLFLKGESLQDYVEWYHRLTPAAAKQWDTFLPSLTTENIDKLLEFRFEGEETPAFREHGELKTLYNSVNGKEPPSEKEDKD